MNQGIWLTWERQVRNRSMASLLGVELRELSWNGPRPLRYAVCGIWTIAIVSRMRPERIFAQNPSIVLICLLLLIRPLFGFTLIADAHFVGVTSPRGNGWHQRLLDLCNYFADLVIVTNEYHKSYIRGRGGKAVVCEDPLPDLSRYRPRDGIRSKSVCFICSYDSDEPYPAAFEAARLLAEEGFSFIVTGNHRAAGLDVSCYPHLTFTGYLPDDDFYATLYNCEVVLDLTENDNCLVCGAYEAMVAEKPLVTSSTECLRRYFTAGTVFTDHSPSGIANAVRNAYCQRDHLHYDIIKWKQAAVERERARRDSIIRELEIITGKSQGAESTAIKHTVRGGAACAESSE